MIALARIVLAQSHMTRDDPQVRTRSSTLEERLQQPV